MEYVSHVAVGQVIEIVTTNTMMRVSGQNGFAVRLPSQRLYANTLPRFQDVALQILDGKKNKIKILLSHNTKINRQRLTQR